VSNDLLYALLVAGRPSEYFHFVLSNLDHIGVCLDRCLSVKSISKRKEEEKKRNGSLMTELRAIKYMRTEKRKKKGKKKGRRHNYLLKKKNVRESVSSSFSLGFNYHRIAPLYSLSF